MVSASVAVGGFMASSDDKSKPKFERAYALLREVGNELAKPGLKDDTEYDLNVLANLIFANTDKSRTGIDILAQSNTVKRPKESAEGNSPKINNLSSDRLAEIESVSDTEAVSNNDSPPSSLGSIEAVPQNEFSGLIKSDLPKDPWEDYIKNRYKIIAGIKYLNSLSRVCDAAWDEYKAKESEISTLEAEIATENLKKQAPQVLEEKGVKGLEGLKKENKGEELEGPKKENRAEKLARLKAELVSDRFPLYMMLRELELYYRQYNNRRKNGPLPVVSKEYQYCQKRMSLEKYWTPIATQTATHSQKAEAKPTLSPSFLRFIGEKIADDIYALKDIWRVTVLIDVLRWVNVHIRIRWALLRMFLFSIFDMLRNSQLLAYINQYLHVNIDNIFNAYSKTNPVFYFFSVTLFFMLAAVKIGPAIKHILFGKEKDTWWGRAWREFHIMYTRFPSLKNSMVWPWLNLITNYTIVPGLTEYGMLLIVAAGLFYDASQVIIDFLRERHIQNNALKDVGNSPVKQFLNKIGEDQRRTLKFYFVALGLMAVGFALSIYLPLPIIGFAIAYFGMSMISTEKKWSHYAQCKKECANNPGDKDAIARCNAAQKEFLIELALNYIMPVAILVAFPICWQLGLVLTISYIAIQVLRAYINYKNTPTPVTNENKDIEMQELASPMHNSKMSFFRKEENEFNGQERVEKGVCFT